MNIFNIRLFLAGLVCIPVGLFFTTLAFGEPPLVPHAIWQGPIISVLGVVLLILSIRMIKADEE